MTDINNYVGKIICADCLTFMKELPDKCVDLVLTDIPYNISQKGNGLRKLDYGEWDKQEGKEQEWIPAIVKVFKQTAVVFCGKRQFSGIELMLAESGCSTRTIIWKKPNPTVLNCDKLYIEATELAVYGKRPNATYNPKYKHNIFNYSAPTNREHPTQKPIQLMQEIIKDCTNEGDIILDPFAGSGSTLVAAELLGRKWIGIEISPEYCAIAEKRIAEARQQHALFEGLQ